MFKKKIIPFVLLTSTIWTFSNVLPIAANAQSVTNDQSRPVTVLKKKDFSITLNALQGLAHRTIPLADMKPNEGVKPQTSLSAEEKTNKQETAEKVEKTETNVEKNQEATHKNDADKNATDKSGDDKEVLDPKIDNKDTIKETSDKETKQDNKDGAVKKDDNTKKENTPKDEVKKPEQSDATQKKNEDNNKKEEKDEKSDDASSEKEQAENKEPEKPQRSVLPRQYIDLHFANYADTRLFLKDLNKKFGLPLAACSRSSINFYRLPDDFTLRVHMTNLNPDEVSPGSSVDGVNGIHMQLIDGKMSDDCDIDTLKPEERVSFDTLKQLAQGILDAKANLDEEKAQTLISSFGTPQREEKECFITYSVKPEKDLPQLDVSISVIKPDCKPKSGYAGLRISYEPLEKNGAVLPNDPAMAIKMARSLEQTFNMEALHNVVYLWKNGDVFGIIKAPISPFIPMAFAIVEPEDKLSMEVGQWFGKDETHYQTLWNAGEQPYGGLTTSEEFIP